MARIKQMILVPAYMNASLPREVEAYLTKADSRFAVAKENGSWVLRHRASGLGLWSLLPTARKNTLAELLSLVAAWEAHTEIDFSPMDDVTFGKGFNKPPPPQLLSTLRDLAVQTIINATA